ncbi:MAG: Gfo/Idh/MocA family oxidoreductase, partial [Planctomycetota bacterium]|nr:Gfo/Idh/MocA family oxidoreductase [Planctomycetota bacterium]
DATAVALVGIGGYGSIYVSALLDANGKAPDHRFAAAVDPFPTLCDRLEELRGRQVPIYPSLAALYEHHRPELVVISSPFHLHAAQTIEALAHGSHVLCEKPMCVTVRQAEQMRRARDHAGRQVAIGYQWSFSPAIQRLKTDIRENVFGAPKRLKTLVLWPRDETYYSRNRWAGKQHDEQGNPIFDSPVSNACAHYLHNMLYVLGEETDRSAAPARVTAELYRAHPIENYDTAALRCRTDGGAEILFVVSHATRKSRGPEFRYEFDKAVVTFSEHGGGEIVAHFKDGTQRSYGSRWESSDTGKLWSTLRAIRSETPTVCGIEASAAQTQVLQAAQDSMPSPLPFPRAIVRVEGEPGMRKTWVEGLEEVLARSYDEFRLPSELNVPWARAGRAVDVAEWRDGQSGATNKSRAGITS